MHHADLVEDELDVLRRGGTALDVGVEHRVLLAELVNIIVVNVANIIFTANEHALEVLVGLLYLWHPRLHDVDHRLPRVQREAEDEDFHVGVVRLSDRFQLRLPTEVKQCQVELLADAAVGETNLAIVLVEVAGHLVLVERVFSKSTSNSAN